MLEFSIFMKTYWFRTKAVLAFNPLMTNVPHYIETSQLICIANHLTGFSMMGNIGH